jgi:hypothetical protein
MDDVRMSQTNLNIFAELTVTRVCTVRYLAPVPVCRLQYTLKYYSTLQVQFYCTTKLCRLTHSLQ